MNSYEFILRLLDTHPGAVFVALAIVTVLTWRTAVLHTNLKYMRENVITKKDLALALAGVQVDLEKWVDARYVTRRECKALLKALEQEGDGG